MSQPPTAEYLTSDWIFQAVAAIALPFSGTFKGRVERKRGMAGILLPGMKARIDRKNDSEADFGAFTLDGLSRTSENIVADEQGRFFYVDRVKDTVRVHGVHVSPSEIEKVIKQHPEVADCAVAGVRGVRQSDGFVPRAWLVLSSSAKAKCVDSVLEAIEEFARSRLSERQWLRGGLEVIDEIPRLPSGRILRRQLQQAHESRERKKAREQAKL